MNGLWLGPSRWTFHYPHLDPYWLKHSYTITDTHMDQCTYTSSSKESVYSCKVKHGKEETNYPPDKWLKLWEASSFFCRSLKPCCCRRLTTGLLLCSIALCLWYSPLQRNTLPTNCLNDWVKMSLCVLVRYIKIELIHSYSNTSTEWCSILTF